MVRLFFLALASLAALACARQEPIWNPIPADSPAGVFAAEVEAYLLKYDQELNQFNLHKGAVLWEELTQVLYRDVRAWDWLEKDDQANWNRGGVKLKPGTSLHDLPPEVEMALQEFLDWNPYGPAEDVGEGYGGHAHSEYLRILIDLLGGQHPIWENYVTMLELDLS